MTLSGPLLGRVETQRVVLFTRDDPLVLESGGTIGPVEVAYETYGELAPDGGNAVFICHALTGDAHAAGHHGDPERRGWWDNLIGPGRPLDTDRLFVICPNLLGGCRGTTGPSSPDPDSPDGRAYGLRFPHFTIRDLVTVHRGLLAHLGIERLHGAIGGSLGGMQVLQWALDAPEQVERAVLVCASARLNAQNIGFTAVARTAIMRDPGFQDGDYVGSGRGPDHGMAVARMMAHLTYVSVEALALKFDRERRRGQQARQTFDIDFQVESYLDHQGRAFLERFDALSYLYLTRPMDYFEPFAEPGVDLGRVAAAGTRFLLLSFDTDWRFGSEHSAYIQQHLAAGALDSEHREIRSPWGHDSFLLDVPEYHAAVAEFLA
ncbi:MAG TPA: homoserine O-acetyltransferase [Solirubrobacteraceae bacterium]|nr:homoserine O-acetyltransferase [Solirubrobacteraceae bacterium]